MARIIAPDGCTGIDVRTELGKTTYNGRMFDTDNARHVRMLKAQGAFVGSTGGIPKAAGYWCGDCSRTSFFVRCGKCGRHNPRET
ncbi:hypothetical protein [Frankia sp. AgW1.1]|uniref:hypothetical protein n=1 Tax=Frankia sp. AgW1.1 TaxID=1836971 RepID=UPI001931D904|nr:hypothetical protein [Frankia sp. AgW1.1]MBL7487091.1 hypothetical protein [Frankia sp. AgW1.1]